MVKQSLYCGNPFVGLREWFGTGQWPANVSDAWPQLRGRAAIGTYRGRTAIALGCRLLGIGPGDEVLVPAYNCGTEIDAVLQSGAKTVGYRVSRSCEIEIADLIARRTGCTRAVYLIHYFGWEQPMAELRRWCDDEGLLLIEDCALALFSDGHSSAIGRTGDAAIFNLPKTLGFCRGGLLSLPASRCGDDLNLSPAGFSCLLKEVLNSARATTIGCLERLGIYGAIYSARHRLRGKRTMSDEDGGLPKMPDNYYFNPDIDADRALHPQAWNVAHSIPWPEIVRRRRANYLRLVDAFEDLTDVKPLYRQLPDGVCPLSLPLLVSNRDTRVEALQAAGIEAFPWWAGFHRNGLDWGRFPDACWLKRNLLTLPIHQGLDDKHLTYVAETAANVLQSVSKRKGGQVVAGYSVP